MVRDAKTNTPHGVINAFANCEEGYCVEVETERMDTRTWLHCLLTQNIIVTKEAESTLLGRGRGVNVSPIMSIGLISQEKMKSFGFVRQCRLGERRLTQFSVADVPALRDILLPKALAMFGCQKILVPVREHQGIGAFLIETTEEKEILDFIPFEESGCHIPDIHLAFSCE